MRALVPAMVMVMTMGAAAWGVPPQLNAQGVLRDAAGVPLEDGTLEVTFRLYDDEGLTTLLWSEVQTIEVFGGVFNTLLPADPIGADLSPAAKAVIATGGALWLTLEPDGQVESEPVPLVSVPYAWTAGRAMVAADLTCSGCIDPSDLSGAALAATALDYDDTTAGLGATTVQGAIDVLSTLVDDLVNSLAAHAADADAHHPADLSGIAINPSSITVGDTTIDSGGLDLGPGANDNLTAAMVTTLTSGPDSNADALHTHTGLGGGGAAGACTTLYDRLPVERCPSGFALFSSGYTFTPFANNSGAIALGSPLCVSGNTSAGLVTGAAVSWAGGPIPGSYFGGGLSCGVCCPSAEPTTCSEVQVFSRPAGFAPLESLTYSYGANYWNAPGYNNPEWGLGGATERRRTITRAVVAAHDGTSLDAHLVIVEHPSGVRAGTFYDVELVADVPSATLSTRIIEARGRVEIDVSKQYRFFWGSNTNGNMSAFTPGLSDGQNPVQLYGCAFGQ